MSMKAGSENLLRFRSAELLGMFSFTDKTSQKGGLTQTEKSKVIIPHEKY